MTLKPILKYPGSKWKLASWIASFFPAHHHYVEPFAGSAAVFFVKTPAPHEVLNDLNGDLVNLFTVIREQGEKLARLIELTPWSEAEYERIEQHVGEGDALERARRLLVRCWQAHGGSIGTTSGWKHNGLGGNAYPVRLWRHRPTRLLAVVERLRMAEIRHRNALELIPAYNAPDCLLYCDPPYVRSTRSRAYYPYEMTDTEHLRLLDLLDRHRGPVVLSSYAHPLYDERLAYWRRVSAVALAEYGKHRTEVLWLNAQAVHCQQLHLFETSTQTE